MLNKDGCGKKRNTALMDEYIYNFRPSVFEKTIIEEKPKEIAKDFALKSLEKHKDKLYQ